MHDRQPVVAGKFYEGNPTALRQQVATLLPPASKKRTALAVLCPHAGLMYSGAVAGSVYASVTIPETIILLGPNHTGRGPAISLYAEGTWHIPGADIPIATDCAKRLLSMMPSISPDELAHHGEHSLEVQLPFLHYLRQDIHIVPITLGTTEFQVCKDLGDCLAALLQETAAQNPAQPAPLIVATTDFNHYESDSITRKKDQYALDTITRVDPIGLYQAVHNQNISMCGLAPTMTAMHVATANHIERSTLVQYATSGDVSGDYQRVVGYGGFIFSHEAT